MSELSRELADLPNRFQILETVLQINTTSVPSPVQILQGDPSRWEVEIWLAQITGATATPLWIGTDPTKVAANKGIPVGTALGLVGRWNVRQDGIRPQMQWWGAFSTPGIVLNLYLIETLVVQ